MRGFEKILTAPLFGGAAYVSIPILTRNAPAYPLNTLKRVYKDAVAHSYRLVVLLPGWLRFYVDELDDENQRRIRRNDVACASGSVGKI